MTNNTASPPVPSLRALLISSLLATLLAIIILILAVLPAEYGIDPTGLGKKMGLTRLSVQADKTVQPVVISCPAPSSIPATDSDRNDSDMQKANQSYAGTTTPTTIWNDSVIITIPANKGLEYKFHLAKSAKLEYSWMTNGGNLYFDFHGEPKGDKTGYFESFKESTDNKSNGALIAPFEGSFGWYWENKADTSVQVLLKTNGTYAVLGLM
jgi:hypothetical protein